MMALPSSLALIESPELAILHALHATLAAAERALLAAHPELDEVDLCSDLPAVSHMACAADLLLSHFTGIERALERYTAQLRRQSILAVPEF